MAEPLAVTDPPTEKRTVTPAIGAPEASLTVAVTQVVVLTAVPTEVFGGAEANNAASIRCMEGAGFTRRSDEPDAEGFLYLERHLTNATLVWC